MLRFRDLSASFSRFWGLRFRSRVLRFRDSVLRASVFVFECFVFETTTRRYILLGENSIFYTTCKNRKIAVAVGVVDHEWSNRLTGLISINSLM